MTTGISLYGIVSSSFVTKSASYALRGCTFGGFIFRGFTFRVCVSSVCLICAGLILFSLSLASTVFAGSTPSQMPNLGLLPVMNTTSSTPAFLNSSDEHNIIHFLNSELVDTFTVVQKPFPLHHSNFSIDHKTGDIYYYSGHTLKLFKISHDGSFEHIDTLHELDDIYHMSLLPDGSGIYFWYHGFGSLYFYSIADKRLEPIIEIEKSKVMYHHGHTVLEDGSIMIGGGYGYWNYSNLIFTANRESSEWDLVETVNKNLPFRRDESRIYTQGDQIYYIVRTDNNNDFQPLGIFRLDLSERKWYKEEGILEKLSQLVDLDRVQFGFPEFNSANYHNPEEDKIFIPYHENEQLHLLEWDLRTSGVQNFRLDHLNLNNVNGLFRDFESNVWRAVKVTKTDSVSTSFKMIAFTLPQMAHSSVAYLPRQNPLLPLFLLSGLIALFIAGFRLSVRRSPVIGTSPSDRSGSFINMEKNRVQTEFKPAEKIITQRIGLHRVANGVVVIQDGKPFKPVEPLEKRFWDLVYESVSNDRWIIAFRELDAGLMPYEEHKSRISKLRNRLLKKVNDDFDEPVFQVRRSTTDKRMKELVLNKEYFTIYD